MNAPNDVPFTQWAAIHATEKFFIVTPLSGYRRHLPEDELYSIYLEPGAPEATLGQAVLEALSKSRFIHPHSDRGFFHRDRIHAADKRWHEEFMRRYRYKTKRDAYKNMRYCLAERCEGNISIQPHKRDAKPTLWWDLPPEKTVVIPETNDPGVVGAAARLALDHCE
jgi:CDI immunity protein